MKTYYELLGVADSVPAEEIKRAFKREIALYHPDKVQHLGTEFQDIAAVRASGLTEAYRVLMDVEARRRYDQSLEEGGGPAAPPSSSPAAPAPPAAESARPRPRPAPPLEPEPPPPPTPDRRFQEERATISHFVRKAGLSRLRDAVAAVAGSADPISINGFDVAFDIKGKGGLFKKAETPVRLLGKFVAQVDAAAIEASWLPGVKAAKGTDVVCMLLLGAAGIAPAKELSLAIAEQRRKVRSACPVVVPVDVRDWEALFPPDAPACVRAIVQWLRQQV